MSQRLFSATIINISLDFALKWLPEFIIEQSVWWFSGWGIKERGFDLWHVDTKGQGAAICTVCLSFISQGRWVANGEGRSDGVYIG